MKTLTKIKNFDRQIGKSAYYQTLNNFLNKIILVSLLILEMFHI